MDSVEIKLDKVRHLRFDMNAIADIEQITGWGIQELAKRMQGQPTVTLIRGCLWAGLLHEDEALTIRQVGGWLTAANTKAVWPKVVEAMNLAFAGDQTASPLADSARPN